MDLQNRIREKSRQLDHKVKESLTGRYDFAAAEMRDLLDEVLAAWMPPLMTYEPFRDEDYLAFMSPGYISNG